MQEKKHLELIVLLNQKYGAVRKQCEQLWNRDRHVKITASECFILCKISGDRLSASEIARLAEITRQAAHKYIRGWQKKGLVETVSLPENKRDKFIQLTPLGSRYLEDCLQMELLLEDQIAAAIGQDTMELLKQILSRDWSV